MSHSELSKKAAELLAGFGVGAEILAACITASTLIQQSQNLISEEGLARQASYQEFFLATGGILILAAILVYARSQRN